MNRSKTFTRCRHFCAISIQDFVATDSQMESSERDYSITVDHDHATFGLSEITAGYYAALPLGRTALSVAAVRLCPSVPCVRFLEIGRTYRLLI